MASKPTDSKLDRTKPIRRCEINAYKGTGQGTCDAPLDKHGECPNASNHNPI